MSTFYWRFEVSIRFIQQNCLKMAIFANLIQLQSSMLDPSFWFEWLNGTFSMQRGTKWFSSSCTSRHILLICDLQLIKKMTFPPFSSSMCDHFESHKHSHEEKQWKTNNLCDKRSGWVSHFCKNSHFRQLCWINLIETSKCQWNVHMLVKMRG